MTDKQLQIPDFLADLLEEEYEEVFASDAQQERIRLPRVTVPQFKPGPSQDFTTLGKIVLVPVDKDAEPVVVETARLMLIDELTYSLRKPLSDGRVTPRHFPQDILANSDYAPFVTVGKEGVGARTMWKLDAEGKRDMSANAPGCGSENGIVPWQKYLGTELLDPRRGELVRIGSMRSTNADGEEVRVPSQYPCLTCPLARWFKTEDGKNLPPVCSHTPKWVVYNVDDGQLYELRGQNRGLLLALSGNPEPKKPTDPAYWDGTPMMGLSYFFASAAENKHVAKALKEALGEDPLPTASISRPYGMPTAQNPNAPVYPVMMWVTLSNFQTSATLVPAFIPTIGGGEVLGYGNVKANAKAVSDSVRKKHEVPNAPLTPEEMAGWLSARKLYHDEGYREQLMARADIPDAISVQHVSPEMLTAPAGKNVLPSGPAPWTEGEIEET